MVKDDSRENEQERESRLVLNRFLTTTDPLLEIVFQRCIIDSKEPLAHRAGKQLHQIWDSARERLRAVVHSIEIGLSKTRRKALEQVGCLGMPSRRNGNSLALIFRKALLSAS